MHSWKISQSLGLGEVSSSLAELLSPAQPRALPSSSAISKRVDSGFALLDEIQRLLEGRSGVPPARSEVSEAVMRPDTYMSKARTKPVPKGFNQWEKESRSDGPRPR
ncbi:unnamed protein product [Caretta caretta]